MFKEVARQQNETPKIASPQQKSRLSTDVKAIKTIAIVVVAFFLCWCPFFVVVLVNGFCKCVSNEHLIVLVKVMHYSNSALNPIIYVWHNTQYRKAFVTALTKFAHLYGAEFVVTFLNKKNNGGKKVASILTKKVKTQYPPMYGTNESPGGSSHIYIILLYDFYNAAKTKKIPVKCIILFI